MKTIFYYFIGFFLIICFSSCDKTVKAKFEITNNTPQIIDSISIEPNVDNDNKFISIKPDNTIYYYSDMTGIKKADGEYLLTYKLDNQIKKKKFGYYTNGYPVETVTSIYIKTDTVLIEPFYSYDKKK